MINMLVQVAVAVEEVAMKESKTIIIIMTVLAAKLVCLIPLRVHLAIKNKKRKESTTIIGNPQDKISSHLR